MRFSFIKNAVLVILLLAVSLVYAETLPPGNWETISNRQFKVYYELQDEKSAYQLLELYDKKMTEFSRQLSLTIPSKIYVFIAPNNARFRYLTKGLPEWTGGAVFVKQRTVVLLSPRVMPDPDQFAITALHEGVHLLTELDGKANLPRWLAEGLAMYLSGETYFRNQVPLARAVILNQTFTLDEIDDVLKLGPQQAKVAYLQSINAVKFLINYTGFSGTSRLVKGLKNGEQIDNLFHEINGFSFLDFEIAWHKELRHRYRWWKFVEWFDFDLALWGSASILVLVMGSITIYRRRKYLKDMDNPYVAEFETSYYSEPFPGELYVDEDQNWNRK